MHYATLNNIVGEL